MTVTHRSPDLAPFELDLAEAEVSPDRSVPDRPHAAGPSPDRRPPYDIRTAVTLAIVWALVVLTAMLVVIYPLGPMRQQREQNRLLRDFRTEVYQAANAQEGLAGVLDGGDTATAPTPGDAVGILDIPRLDLQQVVVEGVGPNQTSRAPGHVIGTAGLGQPGNASVVGRRSSYGGVFSRLSSLRKGDQIVVTTVQGQSLYVVTSVAKMDADRASLRDPSEDDRLTLLTSASRAPWADGRSWVVVARMKGTAFEPTPQGGRTGSDAGTTGDASVLPAVLLLVGLFGVAVAASRHLYRTRKGLTAYLLVTPIIIALGWLLAEQLSMLLPAWA